MKRISVPTAVFMFTALCDPSWTIGTSVKVLHLSNRAIRLCRLTAWCMRFVCHALCKRLLEAAGSRSHQGGLVQRRASV